VSEEDDGYGQPVERKVRETVLRHAVESPTGQRAHPHVRGWEKTGDHAPR
jgi:hypothetical protein